MLPCESFFFFFFLKARFKVIVITFLAPEGSCLLRNSKKTFRSIFKKDSKIISSIGSILKTNQNRATSFLPQ